MATKPRKKFKELTKNEKPTYSKKVWAKKGKAPKGYVEPKGIFRNVTMSDVLHGFKNKTDAKIFSNHNNPYDLL